MPAPFGFVIEADIDGLEQVERLIKGFPQHAQFATALALTKTAKRLQSHYTSRLPSIFDRPTPYVLRSLRTRPATKKNLHAEVLFKDESFKGTPATRYMAPHVYGGRREQKVSEWRLHDAGYLKPNEITVPGTSIRLDQYGNMRRGIITRILSNVRAQGDAAQNTTDSSKARYFYGLIKGTRGIWERYGLGGRSVRPALLFVESPNYEKRFRFYEIGEKFVADVLPDAFIRAFTQAIATARTGK